MPMVFQIANSRVLSVSFVLVRKCASKPNKALRTLLLHLLTGISSCVNVLQGFTDLRHGDEPLMLVALSCLSLSGFWMMSENSLA